MIIIITITRLALIVFVFPFRVAPPGHGGE